MPNVPIHNLTDTWNDAGVTFNAILMNVTDGSSAAASKLINLQVGGAEQFTVDKSGDLVAAGSIAASSFTGTFAGNFTLSGNPAFTGSPDFSSAANKSTIRSDLGLGTLSTQAADSVNIDGGAIDGAAIGANTASTGAFTTLSATGDVTVDTDTLFVDASADHVLVGTTTPINANLPVNSLQVSGIVQGGASPVNVRAFGANPAATAAANLTAFNAASTYAVAADRPIYVPAGIYEIGGEWAASGGSFRIIGDGMNATILHFTTAAGIKHTGGTPDVNGRSNQFTLEGVRIMQNAASDGGDAVSVLFEPAVASSFQTVIRDVVITNGANQSDGSSWANGLVLQNAGEAFLENLNIIFFSDTPDTCVDIRGSDTQSYFFLNFIGCNFNGGKTTFKQRGWLETIYLTNCSGVGGIDVLDLDSSAVTPGTPHLIITGGHYNAKRDVLKTNKWRTIYVLGADLYSGVGSGDVTGTQITMTDATHVKFVGCKVEMGAFSGTVLRDAGVLTDCVNVSFSGCSFLNMNQPALTIQGSSSKAVRFEGCYFLGSGTKSSSDAISINSAIAGPVSISGCQFENFVDGIDDSGGKAIVTGCHFKDVTNAVNGAAGTLAINNKFDTVTNEISGAVTADASVLAAKGPTFNPASSPDTAALSASGGFGGGLVFKDGSGRAGVWSSSSGANLDFGSGGTSSSITASARLNSSGNFQVFGNITGEDLNCDQLNATSPDFSLTTLDNAAITTSGSFGGGIVLKDGTGRAGIWAESTGGRLRIGAGGTSSGLTSSIEVTNSYVAFNHHIILSNTSFPATSSSAGLAGEFAWSSTHIYVCVATNTWKRAALSTW